MRSKLDSVPTIQERAESIRRSAAVALALLTTIEKADSLSTPIEYSSLTTKDLVREAIAQLKDAEEEVFWLTRNASEATLQSKAPTDDELDEEVAVNG